MVAPKSTNFPVAFPAGGPVNSSAVPSPLGRSVGFPRSAEVISGPNTPSKPSTEPTFSTGAATSAPSKRHQYRGADLVISCDHVPACGMLVALLGLEFS